MSCQDYVVETLSQKQEAGCDLAPEATSEGFFCQTFYTRKILGAWILFPAIRYALKVSTRTL